MKGSIDFWKNRYLIGGNSGLGSRNDLLYFKTNFLNNFIKEKNIKSVLDFGCGDLYVANLLEVDNYTGIDIFDFNRESHLNLVTCEFDKYVGAKVDAVFCLDVLYHILKDEQDYMIRSLDNMMEHANRFLVVYAQDSRIEKLDFEYKGHLYNSKWIQHIQKQDNFELIFEQEEPKVGSSAKFFVYEKTK